MQVPMGAYKEEPPELFNCLGKVLIEPRTDEPNILVSAVAELEYNL